MQNFWYYLIDGMTGILQSVLTRLPAHGPDVLSPLVGNFSYGVQPFILWIGSFFDLRLMGVALGIIAALEIVRAVIAAWRWILSLIPAAA